MSETTEKNKPDRVAAIMQLFADALPEKIADIEKHWQDYQADNDDITLQAFCELCHSLAGSAATFGYDDAGDCARAIETVVRLKLDNGEPVDEEDNVIITGHLQRLYDLVDAG